MPAGDCSSSPPSESASSDGGSPAPEQRSLAIRDGNSSKRKRALTAGSTNGATSSRRRTQEAGPDLDHEGMSDEYDPDQSMEERRRLQRAFRNLQKDVAENMEEYMQPNSKGLQEALLQANELSRDVKQTNEAAIDSNLLTTVVDLSYRKTLRLVQGSAAQGVDADEFVSKCITYMRQGGGIVEDDAPSLSSTQRHRRRTTTRGQSGGALGVNDDADDDENDETLNWPHLGRYACLPHTRRPALTGFLVGPLSSEKKVRKFVKRTAPLRREDLAETRPEVLDVEALAKTENDLTAVCARILKQLRDVQARAQATLQDIFERNPDMDPEEQARLMDRHGLRDTGGVDLLRFVVNPKSFGQTVENMFYVSFLIRDGRVAVEFDENELPSLSPVDRGDTTNNPTRPSETAKHQAIFAMDMKTWQDIIDTFDIREPMIEHRKEAQQSGPGARGWYS
ncbi:hypothetical protein SODALDRAFT_313838 [Sodiomyces alkalinus F11]|uniref:Non-structural maintenance of chromosomes element 4 n=1 Tax=Sodiomyces alkalinus (strain CBS 110278 / VKM F-3762 / F11) TaxID=1314773 RepID=A0A3N2PSU9_SODAK|nr:hypothetical protein SODALDRAFT_313838 [Sodiomyces alkalinus F11]ROT37589.1 hypothetical protein SODALDRAFT_313838 [Sodiomyces alkalinus F11]